MKSKTVELAKEVKRSDGWWRFACGNILFTKDLPLEYPFSDVDRLCGEVIFWIKYEIYPGKNVIILLYYWLAKTVWFCCKLSSSQKNASYQIKLAKIPISSQKTYKLIWVIIANQCIQYWAKILMYHWGGK